MESDGGFKYLFIYAMNNRFNHMKKHNLQYFWVVSLLIHTQPILLPKNVQAFIVIIFVISLSVYKIFTMLEYNGTYYRYMTGPYMIIPIFSCIFFLDIE
uniref:Uncharacterized protein n=1 Tax=Lepeophtheirus salmonis TaxID=72036 RepID=A0A0K2U6P4_LEPSM